MTCGHLVVREVFHVAVVACTVVILVVSGARRTLRYMSQALPVDGLYRYAAWAVLDAVQYRLPGRGSWPHADKIYHCAEQSCRAKTEAERSASTV